MSQKNDQGQRTARERLREQQQREQTSAKRLKVLWIGAAIVVVLAVTAGVGALVSQQGAGEADAKAEPVSVGRTSAPAKLTVWEDFRCPACGQFENHFRGTVNGLEKQGALKTEYNLVTIIDGNMGGRGSRNAANAALCARDQGKFKDFHDTLFKNQPMETDDAFADKNTLLKLGAKAGVDGGAFRSCVHQGRHDKDVEATNAAFRTSGHSATPTVLLDGKSIYGQGQQLTPAQLKQKVEAKS
jgi:protein-disulfide isomerase